MQNEGKNPSCRTVFLDTKVISRGVTFRSVMRASILWPKQVGTSTETWGFFCPPACEHFMKDSNEMLPLCTTAQYRGSQTLITSTTGNSTLIKSPAALMLCPLQLFSFLVPPFTVFSPAPALHISYLMCL